jgi:hypothetical protein
MQAGAVREDAETQDFGILQLMVGRVIDVGREVAPELWRRYLAIMLQGLKAPTAPNVPLANPTVTPEQMDAVLMSARRPARSINIRGLE